MSASYCTLLSLKKDMGTQRLANESLVEDKNLLTNQEPSIEPPTPDFKLENGELTDKLLSPNILVLDSNLRNGYQSPIDDDSLTPKACVFDPFAPGADKFMLAPLGKKYTEESRPSAIRQLTFPLSISLVADISHQSGVGAQTGECDLLESLYHNILDVIVSEMSKECVDGVLTEVLDSDSDADAFKTPKSAPRLSWIAKTCPGAPVKSSSKYRNIDRELCRKLEY